MPERASNSPRPVNLTPASGSPAPELTDLFRDAGIVHLGSVQYLWTNADLYKVSVGNLGPMDKGDYDSFMAHAHELATKHGFIRPKLVIDIILKEPNELGAKEQPYPISRDEWAVFVRDGRTMAERMPDVHVVDGDRYTAPI